MARPLDAPDLYRRLDALGGTWMGQDDTLGTMVPSRIVGVEHEYRVSMDGRQVDFREIIDQLPIDGRRIDPGDAYAHRTTSGLKITCDGAEAEIATPPIALARGVTKKLAAWTGHGGQKLVSLLGGLFEVEGVSTHISISLDNDLAPRAAGMFSRTFAPALMLLMDGATSPGLLVRPRRGRLEFGADFVTGDQLAAATVLAAGGAILCERAASSIRAKAKLSPPVRVKVVRAVDRYGWYVARDAFGKDLYQSGRDTVLKRELIGRITAQQSLERAWAAARRALPESLADEDLRAADDIVAGRLELPLESGLDPRPPMVDSAPVTIPLGEAMVDIATPLLTLSAVAATWDYVVFAVQGKTDRYVSVPTPVLGRFLSEAAEGGWDDKIMASSNSVDGPRALSSFLDALEFGLWDAFEFTRRLAPPERGADGIERLRDS